jgi:hypothetical protein
MALPPFKGLHFSFKGRWETSYYLPRVRRQLNSHTFIPDYVTRLNGECLAGLLANKSERDAGRSLAQGPISIWELRVNTTAKSIPCSLVPLSLSLFLAASSKTTTLIVFELFQSSLSDPLTVYYSPPLRWRRRREIKRASWKRRER